MLWTGALTNGQGSACVYGRFWDDGRSHYAHRWAAEHIHGFDIPEGYHVGHTCKPRPNTLCVEHVEPQTPAFNWSLIYGRNELEPEEAITDDPPGVPFYSKPEWLAQFDEDDEGNEGTQDDDCPF